MHFLDFTTAKTGIRILLHCRQQLYKVKYSIPLSPDQHTVKCGSPWSNYGHILQDSQTWSEDDFFRKYMWKDYWYHPVCQMRLIDLGHWLQVGAEMDPMSRQLILHIQYKRNISNTTSYELIVNSYSRVHHLCRETFAGVVLGKAP